MFFVDVTSGMLELLTGDKLAMDPKSPFPGYRAPVVGNLHVAFPSVGFSGKLTVFSPETDQDRKIRGLGGTGGFCFEGNLLHCSIIF